jgi:GWxTD domain-containing protein
MRTLVPTLLLFVALVAAPAAVATVDVVVETKTFHVAGKGPRVEVNMAMLAGSVSLATNAQGYTQAQVQVLTLIEQGGAIKAYAKADVRGAERMDSVAIDLLHQEFFDLPPGAYDLSLEIRDPNNPDTAVTRYRAPLVVPELGSGVSISNVLLAERIEAAPEGVVAKYGYRVVPLLSDYYPSSIGTLDFYAEVYGTDAVFGNDSLYLLTYQLESYEKMAVYGAFKRSVRSKARPVEPVMAQFDIANLPSGNYILAIEVRDRTGALLARREQMVQRNNKIAFDYDLQAMEKLDITGTFAGAVSDRDTLAEHIRSLRPIADPLERKVIGDRYKDRDLELMQRFFYSFWANRSPDPEAAWKAYYTEVLKVNREFGCRILKGYDTDRGYVYLKYGAPNSIMDRFNEMDSYPYTIWHYYRAGRYSDKRFVFYQPNLANDCFELLHSEVPGEIQNPRWNQVLHSRNVAMPNVDPQGVNNSSGERTLEFYNMPR